MLPTSATNLDEVTTTIITSYCHQDSYTNKSFNNKYNHVMVMLILGDDIDILTKVIYILTSHSIRNIIMSW